MTITAVLDLTIKPEATDGALATIEGVLVDTRAFAGCLDVQVLVDVADGRHILIVEKWASLEHDSAYRSWRATPAGASALSSITSSRTLTHFAAPAHK